jgi:group I intron endonuclease
VISSGIYQIRALHNNEVYIGSSSNLGQREKDHFRFLKYGTHDNPKLQAAYNKYGPENFVFEVLLECSPENCLAEEQRHFDNIKPHYNIVLVAGMPPSRKGKKVVFTDQHKEKCRISAQKRGARQRQETKETLKPLCEDIRKSELSVRSYCRLHNLIPNRTSINKVYREYLNDLKEAPTEP